MAANTLDNIPPTYGATIAAAHAVGTHPLPTDIHPIMIARLFWSAEAVADPTLNRQLWQPATAAGMFSIGDLCAAIQGARRFRSMPLSTLKNKRRSNVQSGGCAWWVAQVSMRPAMMTSRWRGGSACRVSIAAHRLQSH